MHSGFVDKHHKKVYEYNDKKYDSFEKLLFYNCRLSLKTLGLGKKIKMPWFNNLERKTSMKINRIEKINGYEDREYKEMKMQERLEWQRRNKIEV